MLPRKQMRKVDVVLSTALLVLGAAVILAAMRMPWGEGRTGGSSAWYLSPGVFPIVVGTMIIAFSLRVLVQAIREGGHRGLLRSFVGWTAELPRNSKVHRVIIVFGLIGIYVLGVIGEVDYYIGTIGFLFVFMMTFYRPFSHDRPWRALLVVVLASSLVPFFFGYIFSTYLYVPLP